MSHHNYYPYQNPYPGPYQTNRGPQQEDETGIRASAGTNPLFPSQLLPPQPHLSQHLPPQQLFHPQQQIQSHHPSAQQSQFQSQQAPPQYYPAQYYPHQQYPMAPPPPPDQQPQEGNIYGDGSFAPAEFFPNTEPDNHEATGTSISQAGSIYDLNGRTYQGYREGKYFLPNDPACCPFHLPVNDFVNDKQVEQDRLDFQHTGITILLEGKLSWVPFETPPKNVLDVATGTGLWAMDFAREHPDADVVGSDISRIQPDANKPDNCRFVQEDSEEPWLHAPNQFDYVHLRLVHSCFDHPRTVIQYAYESLAPGGWIEFHDTCPTLLCAPGTAIERTWEDLIAGAARMGRDITVAPLYKQWLIEAGFTDVQEHKLPWPMNGWHQHPRLKKAGKFMQRMLLDNVRGISYKMLQAKGLSPVEIEARTLQCKEEFQNESIHGFWPFYVVYGRKPQVEGT